MAEHDEVLTVEPEPSDVQYLWLVAYSYEDSRKVWWLAFGDDEGAARAWTPYESTQRNLARITRRRVMRVPIRWEDLR